MTEILCKWLNNDVKLTRVVSKWKSTSSKVSILKLNKFYLDPANFAQDFSNGYLIGEILSKHGLQDDFSQFSQSKYDYF